MMAVPFVSYEVRGDDFIPRTPMASKFLRMMLEYTRVFADEKQFFDHIRQQFTTAHGTGSLFWFGKLKVDT